MSVIVDERAVLEIAHEAWMREVLVRLAEDRIVASARRLAPVRRRGASRGGAGSIHAEAGHDERGWFVDVSWDREHDYMRFADFVRSRHSRPQHFLEQAVRENERPT